MCDGVGKGYRNKCLFCPSVSTVFSGANVVEFHLILSRERVRLRKASIELGQRKRARKRWRRVEERVRLRKASIELKHTGQRKRARKRWRRVENTQGYIYLTWKGETQLVPTPSIKALHQYHIGVVISHYDTGSGCNEDSILTSDFLLWDWKNTASLCWHLRG